MSSAILMSATVAFAPPPTPIRALATSRSTTLKCNIAVEALTFNPNPISLTIVAFTLAWGSAPIIGSTSLREADFIQNGIKMPTTKREPPKVRGVRLPRAALAFADGFTKDYTSKELELLWSALLKCYGSEKLALNAVEDNPQMLNPSYSFCNTMLDSKKALLSVMSAEEALDVMKKNPAVLQCGPSLGMLGAGEIKGFAQARSMGNALVPARARGAAVGALLAAVAVAIVFQGTEDPQMLAVLEVLRPVLGGVLASSFLFTAYAAARSS